MVSTAARSPLIDTSICSPRVGAAEQIAGRAAVQQHLEDVLAVGREDVHDRDAAARAHRRAAHVPHLRAVAWQLVDRRGRRRVAIADRQTADRAARRAGSLPSPPADNPCSSEMLSKPCASVSGGSYAVDVDVEPEQLAHRAGVLGAIQPLRGTRTRDWDSSAAARSMRVSSAAASAVSARRSGRFAPAGGIIPARSLRIIFSTIGALSAAWRHRTPRARARRPCRDRCDSSCSTA